MQIISFPAHYQSVYTNFDISSFSLISCHAQTTVWWEETMVCWQQTIVCPEQTISRLIEALQNAIKQIHNTRSLNNVSYSNHHKAYFSRKRLCNSWQFRRKSLTLHRKSAKPIQLSWQSDSFVMSRSPVRVRLSALKDVKDSSFASLFFVLVKDEGEIVE